MSDTELSRNDFLPDPPPDKDWKPLKRVLTINLGILLLYSIIMSFVAWGERGQHLGGLGAGLGMLILVVGQTVINLIAMIAMFIRRQNPWGQAFLLGAIVVAIAGASACFGAVSFAG